MGCARKFKEKRPQTKVIAVDSVGSVTFDAPPRKRYVPGLGTSRKPEIALKDCLDEIMFVQELDGIRMCNELRDKYGLLLGGSSGSVLHGVRSFQGYSNKNNIVVTISPDFGYKYAEMVYNPAWIEEKFGVRNEVIKP
jgi:cysteine synthase A